MRKSAALFAAMVVAPLIIASLPAFSQENNQTTISDYCVSHIDLGLSHGACVVYLTTHNLVPHDAIVCQDANMQNFLGVTNHGQCMKKLSDMRR